MQYFKHSKELISRSKLNTLHTTQAHMPSVRWVKYYGKKGFDLLVNG